jgi:hypothetical protein
MHCGLLHLNIDGHTLPSILILDTYHHDIPMHDVHKINIRGKTSVRPHISSPKFVIGFTLNIVYVVYTKICRGRLILLQMGTI